MSRTRCLCRRLLLQHKGTGSRGQERTSSHRLSMFPSVDTLSAESSLQRDLHLGQPGALQERLPVSPRSSCSGDPATVLRFSGPAYPFSCNGGVIIAALAVGFVSTEPPALVVGAAWPSGNINPAQTAVSYRGPEAYDLAHAALLSNVVKMARPAWVKQRYAFRSGTPARPWARRASAS